MSHPSSTSALFSESLDLLLRSALSPKEDAIICWKKWRSSYDIELTPWNEVRLLGTIAQRIDWLESDSAIRSRMIGIRKFLWVQTQLCLQKTKLGLLTLNRAEIPFILLKGCGRIVQSPSAAQERLIRDMDILVPLRLRDRAFTVLESDGWKMTPDPWQLDYFQKAPISGHHAWALTKNSAEIDLHHYSNYLNRLVGDDDQLWKLSKEHYWNGVNVRILSPAHALLTNLTHGLRWSLDYVADWVIDSCALIESHAIDWEVLLLECRSRLLQAVAFEGLQYLTQFVAQSIPPKILSTLEQELTPEMISELNDFYKIMPSPIEPHQVKVAHALAIQRVEQKLYIPPLPKKLSKILFSYNSSLSANNSLYIGISPQDLEGSWLMISIHLVLNNSMDENKLLGRFSSTGVEFKHASPDILLDHDGKKIANFRLEIPVAMFRLRGITNIYFNYSMYNEKTSELTVKLEGFLV
ncbi:nucleotidyltransferase family protein [Polynucleobacter sphagniphilus]|jgi:hypothetical protein|uniref:Uncharacterized protein n=1 Tax=Polynucleobacter sphagniphilus TaxID=1743169 RepID=A0AA43MCU9_9BURK|nr:nucleotidyltransferase family protein [Polynucleobacter sphagniphilus]MDH6504892.1 hypothetical protein [Polynucleobacter sphagniphilus]MDH6513598.1 hypothetical protein [Polynucleobacter sphagniphilus]